MDDFNRLVLPAYIGDPATYSSVAASLQRSSFNAELAALWFRDGSARYDLRQTLRDIRVPTLVAVGELDWIMPPSASRKLAAQIPNAELVIVQGVGHFMFGEAPEEFQRLVGQCVTGAAGPGDGGS